MRDTTETFIVGSIFGFCLASIIWTGISIYDKNIPDELSCRNGKLFEVTTEGNISIYKPTYNDCEVQK